MNAMNDIDATAPVDLRGRRIAYLINQYPKVSHTFIRREIFALEALGMKVERFSLRPTRELLPDPVDRDEQTRTRALLSDGTWTLGSSLLRQLCSRQSRATVQAALSAGQLAANGGNQLIRHTAYLAEACRLREILLKSGVDHVHAHFGTNSTTVAMLCHQMGGPPYSFTVHGPEEFDRSDSIGLDIKIRQASFVAAISNFARAQLWRHCPAASWNKIHVVRCGLDTDFFNHQPTSVPVEPKLVAIGRLCEQKGQLLLLKAARNLKRSGMNFRLVLVGDGPMRDLVSRAVRAEGLDGTVTITGWQSTQQIREHLLTSRALVLPSFAEGLPVVIMEALAMARPVISTFVAGIPELVHPGENGWLVPAGDETSLQSVMRDALSADPERLYDMGCRGREIVMQHHDVNNSATQLLSLFTGG